MAPRSISMQHDVRPPVDRSTDRPVPTSAVTVTVPGQSRTDRWVPVYANAGPDCYWLVTGGRRAG